jgi:hypothetical protein
VGCQESVERFRKENVSVDNQKRSSSKQIESVAHATRGAQECGFDHDGHRWGAFASFDEAFDEDSEMVGVDDNMIDPDARQEAQLMLEYRELTDPDQRLRQARFEPCESCAATGGQNHRLHEPSM